MMSVEDMLAYLNINLDEQSFIVLDVLKAQKKVDENKLAERLKVKVNAVRKAMYKLSEHGYAVYTKRKSKSKKWWYEYDWRLDLVKLLSDYTLKKRDELKEREEKLAREQEYAFICPQCCGKFTYEEGLEHAFECPKCGITLDEIASSKFIKALNCEIDSLRAEIGEIEGELKKSKPRAEKLALKAGKKVKKSNSKKR